MDVIDKVTEHTLLSIRLCGTLDAPTIDSTLINFVCIVWVSSLSLSLFVISSNEDETRANQKSPIVIGRCRRHHVCCCRICRSYRHNKQHRKENKKITKNFQHIISFRFISFHSSTKGSLILFCVNVRGCVCV